jgi:hypothetical protein
MSERAKDALFLLAAAIALTAAMESHSALCSVVWLAGYFAGRLAESTPERRAN